MPLHNLQMKLLQLMAKKRLTQMFQYWVKAQTGKTWFLNLLQYKAIVTLLKVEEKRQHLLLVNPI